MSVWDMDEPVWLPWALLQATFPLIVIFGMLQVLLHLPVSPPSRAPIGPFAGCYTDGRSSIALGADGILRDGDKKIGTFYIHEAVGGKHGPLVQADNVVAMYVDGMIEFRRGINNYYWSIDRKGNMSILFADVGYRDLKKTVSGSCRSVNNIPTRDASSRRAET